MMYIFRRSLLLFCCISIFICGLTWITFIHTDILKSNHFKFARSRQDDSQPSNGIKDAPPDYKRILLWTTFWGSNSDNWETIFFRMLERRCPVSQCELVYDLRLLNTSDAVLFHPINFLNTTRLPPYRPPHQPWVFFTLEAPAVAGLFDIDYGRLNGIMNWTMSYRRDSDIYVPYGRINAKGESKEDVELDPWSKKVPEKMVAWMVSHCSTDSRREWFVKDMIKHIPVHVYGRCGFMKCGKHISVRTIGTFDQEPCNKEIDEYFFYLAFENAICEDYVTEKFYMALQRDTIPVVFGGANYREVAPPRSYINALDFQSPEELAKALILISKNKTLYNSFFEWKKHYTVEIGHPFLPMICDLCARLHGSPNIQNPSNVRTPGAPEGLNPRIKEKEFFDNGEGFYPDIASWYVTGAACRRWFGGAKDYRYHGIDKKIPYRDPMAPLFKSVNTTNVTIVNF